MKGLFVKDICLIKQKKKTLLMYLLLVFLLTFTVDGGFLVAYITLIGALTALNTISYDEHDNGYRFLMTMPVEPRDYAVEKHLFVSAAMIVSWCFGVVFQTACSLVRGLPMQLSGNLPLYAAYLPLLLILYSLVLSIELRFGSDKGKMALLVLFGIVAAVVLLCGKILEALGIDPDALPLELSNVPWPLIVAGIALLTLLIIAGCMAYSVRAMEKKEY